MGEPAPPTSPSDVCAICPRIRADHDDPAVQHWFSSTGELRGKPQSGPVKKTQVKLAPEQMMSARLALVLQRRGIITDDDTNFVLTGGTDASNPPSTDGGASTPDNPGS